MKTIITYSTLTGNTETCVDWIREGLTGAGYTVKVQEAGEVFPSALKNFDLIILGSPTYWSGDVTDEFIPFLDEMTEVNLSHKKAAVFGLGDSQGYPDEFCRSVDVIEENLRKCGAELIVEPLKIDGDPEDQKELILAWVNQIVERA